MLGSFNSGTLGFGVILRAKDAFSREFAKFRKELNLTGIAVDKFERKTRNAGAKLAALGGMSYGIANAANLMKDLSNVAGEYEQIETAIKSISGGDLAGGKLIDDLRKYTLESPLGFEELVKNAKKLLAHGIPLSEVMNDLKMLTELSAGVGLDKFPFLALAYGQTMAGGRATGQENLQFINAGIGIRKEVAKLYKEQGGAAMSAAAKQLKADDVKKALYNLTKEGGKFHNLINRQMQTFKGLMSVLADSMYFLKVEMGTVINDRYKNILRSMTVLAEKFVTFLLSDRGKSTILMFLKFFEVFAIGTLITALFAGTKFLLYMTAFLLPQATKQTFMLAVMNNRLGRAFSVLFRSVFRLRFALYNIVLNLAMIGAGVYVVHKAFQSLFHTDYIKRFMLIMTTFFELLKNYKSIYTNKDGEGFMIGGESTLSADTVNALYNNPQTAKFAIGLFVIYADIRRMVFGIAQGMFAILEVAYNIAAAIGGAFKKLLQFFGILDENNLEEFDTLGGFGFINDKLITNVGRFIGVFLGIKLVYNIVLKIINAFKIFRKVMRTLRPTNLRRMFATSRIGRFTNRLTKDGSLINKTFKSINSSIGSTAKKIKDFLVDFLRVWKIIGRYERMRIKRKLRPIGNFFNPLAPIQSKRQVAFHNTIAKFKRLGRRIRVAFFRTGLGRFIRRMTTTIALSARLSNTFGRLGKTMNKAFKSIGNKLKGVTSAIRRMTSNLRRAIVASKIFNKVTSKGLNSIFRKLLLIPALLLMAFAIIKVGIERLGGWVSDKAPWLAGWFGMSEKDAAKARVEQAKEDEKRGVKTERIPASSPAAEGGVETGDPEKNPKDWEIRPMPTGASNPTGAMLPPTTVKVYLNDREVGTAVVDSLNKRGEGGY